jgi:anti-sigma factor RsiW
MSPERPTPCIDFVRRFDSFVDGELDAHSMRAMALHASHCAPCGTELERAENLQTVMGEAVEAELGRLETSQLWKAIEIRLERPRPGLSARAGSILEAIVRWSRPVPALALGGALAVALLALLWSSTRAPEAPLELANNHAQIERIESSAPHVVVWSEPESHTTAIWVASYEPEGGR